MICPKCQDLMRTISRGAVHVEQCDNCKGVFLDGGELEQIIAAERAHYAQPGAAPTVMTPVEGELPVPAAAAETPPPYQPPPGTVPNMPPGAPPRYQPPPGTVPGPPPPPYPGGHHDHQHYQQRRRRSFLEELLD